MILSVKGAAQLEILWSISSVGSPGASGHPTEED